MKCLHYAAVAALMGVLAVGCDNKPYTLDRSVVPVTGGADAGGGGRDVGLPECVSDDDCAPHEACRGGECLTEEPPPAGDCGTLCDNYTDCLVRSFGPGTEPHEDCCRAGDPCGWAEDGYCDCEGEFRWDDADCTVSNYDHCMADCADRHTEARREDCDTALVAYHECIIRNGGLCGDDDLDAYCGFQALAYRQCVSDICPGYAGADSCCYGDDPCAFTGDGYCDCDGMCGWDQGDCGS